MKVGMIGIGDIAKKAYLPVLTQLSGIELHVYTRNAHTLQEVAAQYRIKHIYTSFEDLVNSGVKAVFVHSSTESHEAIIDKLLNHNLHVYVDKPITYDGPSSERLIQKAKDRGLLLMVGFNRRFAPPYQALKDVKDPNLLIVEKHRGHQAADPRTFIFDDFIHVIDTLLYLFPYSIEHYRVRAKLADNQLHHVMLQLEAKEGTAIGIMNREAGTTEEQVKICSTTETRTVRNIRDEASFQNKTMTLKGSDDWEPTLYKRGFHHIVECFLHKVRTETIQPKDYAEDLERHLVAELVVNAIHEKNSEFS
ncbi:MULTISPECIES: Gfo/Idh/MocA family oxidoreductase [unclassified Virgibacillus]|uniref:Gfo/Idh/MocA family protein n=1 Tax=unclassified Virgibacillus TaxID=2620237 RepID=UPI0024DE142E|nr:Gfo/Idh/MocA family oxidoreductase [Virgibacillus sp. LDC-1]